MHKTWLKAHVCESPVFVVSLTPTHAESRDDTDKLKYYYNRRAASTHLISGRIHLQLNLLQVGRRLLLLIFTSSLRLVRHVHGLCLEQISGVSDRVQTQRQTDWRRLASSRRTKYSLRGGERTSLCRLNPQQLNTNTRPIRAVHAAAIISVRTGTLVYSEYEGRKPR